MNDEKCPYCNEEIEINHDDNYGYEEGFKHEQVCSKCDNIFVYETYINIDHTLYKCDCLNGKEDHRWEKTDNYPYEFTRWKCAVCDNEKPLSKEEMEEFLKDKKR